MRRLSTCLLVLLFARNAAAQEPEKWNKGSRGYRRVAHLSMTAIGGALYLTSEYFVKDKLAPESCHWCVPGSFDSNMRGRMKWDNTDRAHQLSNLTGFVLAPVSAIGLITIAGWGEHGGMTAHWLDDTLPILESGIGASLFSQATKFAVGRERPEAHFAEAHVVNVDDNLSFYSGHTTLAFSLAVSSGMVAHYRNYRMEPIVWATGLTIATATGYFRIAADKHYFTDVAVGAAAGAAVGVVVPTLLHRPNLEGLSIHATPNSVAVRGKF